MLINDDECDTEYPEVLDDERLLSHDPLNPLQPTLLLATVHIARLLSPLAKMFRSLCITSDTLAKFETHLGECMYLFPKQLQLSSTVPLDPAVMAPIIHFQNARLLLHRHNMSPSCSQDQRSQAIAQCLKAARDTAGLMSRCMVAPPQGNNDWEQRLAVSASTLLCTHLWRCMLFLLFRHFHEAFFLLFRTAAIIGDNKVVNVPCGRHLSFFVGRLIARYEKDNVDDLDSDEELLVYLSGDLQAGTNSWVWGNTETGTHLSRRQKHGRPRQSDHEYETPATAIAQTGPWDSVLSEEELRDWGGWQQLERSARYLQQLQEKSQTQSAERQPYSLPKIPTPVPDARSQQQPADLASAAAVGQPNDSKRSRMTIANII